MASESPPSSSSEWTDEQIESMMINIMITLASITIFYFLLRPRKNQQQNPTPTPQTRQQQVATPVQHRTNLRNRNTSNSANNNNNNNTIRSNSNHSATTANTRPTINNEDEEGDEGVQSLLAANTRKPPHFTNPSSTTAAAGGGGGGLGIPSRVYHEGIIPFRYTLASTFESRSAAASLTSTEKDTATPSKSSQQLINRKDRARVFTKLFSPSLSNENGNGNNNTTIPPPPNRGSNVVITIPQSDIPCLKLQRVLFLLGTYYNLFLMIDTTKKHDDNLGISDDDDIGMENTCSTRTQSKKSSVDDNYIKDKKRLNDFILQLRSTTSDDDENSGSNSHCGLSEEVLPSHRIIMTSSVSSRVVSFF